MDILIPDAAKPKTRLDAALTGIKPGAGVPSREDELKLSEIKQKQILLLRVKIDHLILEIGTSEREQTMIQDLISVNTLIVVSDPLL